MSDPATSSDRRFLSSVSWSFLAAAVPSSATFLGTILVARELGREAFGRFSLIQTTVVAFGLYAPVALGTTSAKYVAELSVASGQAARRVRRSLFRISLLIGTVCALTIAWLSPVLSRAAFDDATLVRPLQLASLGLLVLGLLATVTGGLSGYGRFRDLALVGLVRGSSTLAGLAVGARLAGLNGAIAGLVLAWSIAFFTAAVLLTRTEATTASDREEVRGPTTKSLLLAFSLPVFLAPGAFLLVNAIIAYDLARSPGGPSQVAVWNAAMQLRLLLLFIPTTLTTPLLVSVAAATAHNHRGTSRRTIRLSVLVTVLSVWLPAAAMLPRLDSVLTIFGPSFGGTGVVVARILAATVVSTIPLLIETLLRGAGYAWRAASITFAWGTVMLAGLLVVDDRNAATTAGVLFLSYASVIPLSLYLWRGARRATSSVASSTPPRPLPS